MTSKMILSVAAAALLFSSCRKTEDVSPDTRGVLAYQLKAANTAGNTSGKVSSEGTINWNSGYAYPREMRFEAQAEGGQKADYRTLDTSRIDLFARVTKPFGHVALAQGNYKEVEMSIKLNPRAVFPGVKLMGTYTSSAGATVPVNLEIFDVCEIKTEVKDITIDDKTNFEAVTSLDLSVLSNGITENMINNAELKDGVVFISRDTNKELYTLIVDNLKAKRHAIQVSKR